MQKKFVPDKRFRWP